MDMQDVWIGRYIVATVEVVLRHFHRCSYRSSTTMVLLLEWALVS
jgi:hypothetical protein